MYATDATRLSGELRHDLSSLGDDLGVQDAMMETWLSYAFFLLHCLKCQQVPFEGLRKPWRAPGEEPRSPRTVTFVFPRVF